MSRGIRGTQKITQRSHGGKWDLSVQKRHAVCPKWLCPITASLLTPYPSLSHSLFWIIFLMLSHISRDKKQTENKQNPDKKQKVSSLGKEYPIIWYIAYIFYTADFLPPFPQELDAFQPYPAEIMPGKIYLGNFRQACDPKIQKDLKIKAHVNISMETGPLWVEIHLIFKN